MKKGLTLPLYSSTGCLFRVAWNGTGLPDLLHQFDREGEATCNSLNGNRPKSSMSHHFSVLRESGLLRTRNDGTTHINTLRREEIAHLFPGLLAVILAVPPAGSNGKHTKKYHLSAARATCVAHLTFRVGTECTSSGHQTACAYIATEKQQGGPL